MKAVSPECRLIIDTQNMNKYNFLKKLIYPHRLLNLNKHRYGGSEDGSYVFVKEVFESSKNVYSYGIGSDVSFDKCCAEMGKKVFMYDASIEEPPEFHSNFNFKKEFLLSGLIKDHILENGHGEEDTDMILKMDIEGHEYDVINKDIDLIKKHFSQISIEIHGLIEEIPEGWVIDDLLKKIKPDKILKETFFKNLSKYYNIIHIHGNNHSYRFFDFPDSLEISFLRKDFPTLGGDDISFPVDGLDFPNYDMVEDFKLDWWI
jgi:hypothetical protein